MFPLHLKIASLNKRSDDFAAVKIHVVISGL
jgi:hypothetical protein